MTTTSSVPVLVQEKLAAFEQLEPEFTASFQFLQEVHGQKRLHIFPVADTVRYLHARWVDECKSCLLSIAKTVKEYEGRRCLELLLRWQQELDTASVVSYLEQKLDMLPLATITQQIHGARQQGSDESVVQRLVHGRMIMLNRGINLLLALDAIFMLPEDALTVAVQQACADYGHRPDQIEQQLREMEQPLYSYVPHQVLAQRNMTVMNKLGVDLLQKPADLPEQRTERVDKPELPLSPLAEEVIGGYHELTSPTHNNVKEHPFVDRLEQSDTGTV